MSELEPSLHHQDTPTAGHARRGLRASSLLRGERVVERGLVAVRRLLDVMAVAGPGCTLVLTFGAIDGRGGNVLTLHMEGDAPEEWADDIAWCLSDVARLEPWRVTDRPVPSHLAELREVRRVGPTAGPAAGPVAGPADEGEAHPRDAALAEVRRQRLLRELPPRPQPLHVDLAELLAGNVAGRGARLGLVVRHRLTAAHPIEAQLLTEEVLTTWDPSRGSAHDYLGTPVCLRTLWGREAGPLPARVRAMARQHGSGLDLVELTPDEAASAWTGGALDLAGFAVPTGTAIALLRLPVAGDQPFPGMRTEQAAVAVRPMDPQPPRPALPVRLGRAQTAAGTWTDASIDLATGMTRHVVIQGATGTGKSTAEVAIAVGVIKAGGSVSFLDPEGSSISAVLAGLTAEQGARVRVIRHGHPELDVPLNLMTQDPAKLERMVGLYAEMIQRAQDPGNEGIVGPRWRRWFTLVTLATVKLLGADASLVAVGSIAGDMGRIRALARQLRPLDAELAHRLQSEYGDLSGKESADLTSWGVSKLQELLSSEQVRWILGAGPDAVDVRAAMDDGTSLLVDLGAHRLGEPAGRAIASTYLLKHWAALSERTRRDRPHVLIIDEAHVLAYGPLPKLLAEARKFGVAVVVATQHLGQLTGELADALEANTGSVIALRSGLQSAQRVSARLEGWPVPELLRLPDLTAAATLSCDGIQTAPFTLHLDHHARVRRLAGRGLVGPHVAAGIQAASHREADRYRGLTPISDQELAARLEPSSARRPRRPSPDGSSDRPMLAPASALDEWLARRATIPSTSVDDGDTPGETGAEAQA